ncbi:hypothetical protein EDD68_105107 [Melghiribacillus thermohalophilus]|uniref:Uncharacterized protein n=1 Tax=Melghiribacillus thermohalophilus TaxID=1324956 RepID=A0A4R3N5Z4_9BACI|nr:hypothetical protein [Melghiribacillus thermohalophilus]TCT24650.1 hypothetical protein EDD68_105107 [Melghiribacillus thermohalophilus]
MSKMPRKKVYCEKCTDEIKYRDDLTTARLFVEVVPYHNDCYAKDLKSAKTFFLDNQPINGTSGNFLGIISVFFILFFLLIVDGLEQIVAFAFVIPLLYRVYSYVVYERHLEK